MTKFFNARALALSFAAASVLAIAAPVHAQTTDGPISISVPYADLDVGHTAGAQILLQRIEAASVRACGGAPDMRELKQRAAFDACRAQAVSQAVERVNAPVVTALASRGLAPVRTAAR
jgi:UrcA family protein